MIGQTAKSGVSQLQRARAGGAVPLHRARAARILRCRAAPVAESSSVVSSSSNGKAPAATCPTPAETARTIVDIVNEGSLCSVCADGWPLGAPVAFSLDKDGQPIVQMQAASPEAANLQRDARASLLVQATAFPARGVASVALQGTVSPHDLGDDSSSGVAAFKLEVQQCMYYGGHDNSGVGQAVSGDEYRAAEPDTLRRSAVALTAAWNADRAEDVYRIVASHLGVPLTEMAYAELLWLDRLGMYIRSEVAGRAPDVVRVPFYRPVLDERDARSVITMAAQIAWEAERSYTPPAVL